MLRPLRAAFQPWLRGGNTFGGLDCNFHNLQAYPHPTSAAANERTETTTLKRPPERIRDAKIILGRVDRGPTVEVLVDPQAPIQVPDELPTHIRIRTESKTTSLGKAGKDPHAACQIEDLEAE